MAFNFVLVFIQFWGILSILTQHVLVLKIIIVLVLVHEIATIFVLIFLLVHKNNTSSKFKQSDDR